MQPRSRYSNCKIGGSPLHYQMICISHHKLLFNEDTQKKGDCSFSWMMGMSSVSSYMVLLYSHCPTGTHTWEALKKYLLIV